MVCVLNDKRPGLWAFKVTLATPVVSLIRGETDREFNELLNFVEKVEFDRLGVFTYSEEEGTYGSTLNDDIPDIVPEIGYLDDAVVARWVIESISKDLPEVSLA